MSGPIVVTGATGFIGSYVVRRLVAAGAAVRVLARRPERLPAGAAVRVQVVRGDVRDARALRAAVGGADTVLHLAGLARAWGRAEEFTAVNVEAVAALLDAARAAEVRRLVHVSSVVTLPPYRRAALQGPAARATPYEASKLAGEELVEAYAAEARHAVVVHPTRVYGPGPLHDANGVTQVIALYLAGRFRLRIADGDVLGSYVHADDVAGGIIAAAERGAAGAHYVLGGENASFREFLALLGDVTGVRRRVLAVPPRVALAVGRAGEWWGRLGGAPSLTRGWVRVFLEDRRVDVEPARRDLGYAPRPLRAGLEQTVAWLRNGRHAA